jgi:putative DNA primase/helicase
MKPHDEPLGVIAPTEVQAMRETVAAQVEREQARYCSEPNHNNGSVHDHGTGGLTSLEILRACDAHEDGDAWIAIQIFRGRLCFDHSAGRWFIYTGHHWEEANLNEQIAMLEEVIGVYGEEAKKQAWLRLKAAKDRDKDAENEAKANEDKLLRRIGELQHLPRKKRILELAAAGVDSLGMTGREWNADPWKLGCANGTIVLRTGEFRPGMPEEFIRTAAPTDWAGLNAQSPQYERFLLEIFNGCEALVAFLQRLLGCAIIGAVLEHFLVVLWGPGRNGKSTILEVLGHTLGRLAGAVQAELLLAQKWTRSSAGPSSDILALRGRLLAWASESGKGQQIDAGKVKWLTGGDSLVGRAPYGRDEVTFAPSHTLFLLTNHRPRVDPTDFALWERIFLIPFELSFVSEPVKPNERKSNPYLLEKLKSEASGILSWLVRGALEYQRVGLCPPESVKAATKEYQKAEDLLAHFIDDCCTIQPGAEVKAGELYEAYRAWCDVMGHRAMSGTTFGGRIKEQCPAEKRGHVFYQGIGLLASASPGQAEN